MNIKCVGLTAFLLASGCSAVDPETSLDQLRTEVAERAAVSVDWDAERQGNEALVAYISAKLAGELTADDAVAVSLLKSPTLRARYRELGVAQSDVVAAGLAANPVFEVERRFRGRAAELDVAQEFLSIFLLPLKLWWTPGSRPKADDSSRACFITAG